MSLADEPLARAGWIARATFLTKALDDLRTQITVAVGQRPGTNITIRLAEIDVHCALAQNELREAIARMNAIT